MNQRVQRLGILAGGGNLPLEVAEQARAAGCDIHIVAIDGEADNAFSGFGVTRVNWGAIGKMVGSFKSRDIKDIVIVGNVTRPDMKTIKPDFGFFKSLPRIIKIVRSGGDDSVLRLVVGFFESHGLNVLGIPDVAPSLLIGPGPYGSEQAAENDYRDIAVGFDVIRRLGRFDVGQGVVVNEGQIEAIEGAEGTDRMLQRVALMRVTKFSKSQRGVLVKRPKPTQELRVDLPTIGPNTATQASRAGLAGIAVLENATMAARRDALIANADESQLFIEGCADNSDVHIDKAPFTGDLSFVQLGGIALTRRDDIDLRQAVGVLEAIAPYEVGGAVAVARNHVLAIEVGEGLQSFMERLKSLRQWRGRIMDKQVGMAIFGHAQPFGTDLISAAHEAGLQGVIIASDALTKQEWSVAIVKANTLKLFVGALTVSSRETA